MFLGRYHSYESFLYHFQDRTHVFEVFEALWPKEFKAMGVTPVSPVADRVRAYQGLFDLLREKMPLWECEWEMMLEEGDEAMEDDFIRHIPLEPQGQDYDECSPDYVSLAERVILTICSDYEDDVVKSLVRTRVPYGQIDKDTLLDVCLQQAAVPSGLYDAFCRVYGATGNVWLDINPELYDASEKPEWSVQAVNWLIGEWQDAQPIFARIKEFNAWLEKDLRRIRQVEKWLKEATQPRQRVRIGGPQPLIQTLSGSLLTDFDEGFDDED